MIHYLTLPADVHHMDDRIPLTDFYKRLFPMVTEDEKTDFIVNTNKFERINLSKETVISNLVQPHQADPAVAGQYRAIQFIIDLASDPNLIPTQKLITSTTFDKQFSWFKLLHKNIMFDFYRKGEQLHNTVDYPTLREIGVYRYDEKILGNRIMPRPEHIKNLLVSAFNDYISIYKRYADNLSNPRMLELKDFKRLEKACYDLNIHICCIKPFKDGSNRVARLTENLLRLNCGLRFRTFDDCKDLLNDIWKVQDSKYYI